MMGFGWGMGAGGWIAMAVFWIGLLVLVGWAGVRAFPTGRDKEPRAETPDEILDRRFAAGELDAETYQSMRVALTSSRTGRR